MVVAEEKQAEVVGSTPIGPFLSVLEIRYYCEFIFGKCRTKRARTSNEELQLSTNVTEHTMRSL